MRYLKTFVYVLGLGALVLAVNPVQAFSFDFGDDDDDYWYYSYYGGYNRPWIAPNGMLFYPRLPYFERQRLIDRRQHYMGRRYDAMQQLGAMLYGRDGFDRSKAIKLARGIEGTAGRALTDDFHPGSIASYNSRTTLALWGNRQAFDTNAETLKQAARALAEELQKQPAKEEGAVFLPALDQASDGSDQQKLAVSPGVWDKFNALSEACDSCHRGFRGFRRY